MRDIRGDLQERLKKRRSKSSLPTISVKEWSSSSKKNAMQGSLS
jgi:hypothetical protein